MIFIVQPFQKGAVGLEGALIITRLQEGFHLQPQRLLIQFLAVQQRAEQIGRRQMGTLLTELFCTLDDGDPPQPREPRTFTFQPGTVFTVHIHPVQKRAAVVVECFLPAPCIRCLLELGHVGANVPAEAGALHLQQRQPGQFTNAAE